MSASDPFSARDTLTTALGEHTIYSFDTERGDDTVEAIPLDTTVVDLSLTGIGLTAPNGNDWDSFREALLAKQSGVQEYEIRYFGKTLAGICNFDAKRYQSKKDVRRGTRAGRPQPF